MTKVIGWWRLACLLALAVPCAGRATLVSVSSGAPVDDVILSYDTSGTQSDRTSDAGNLFAAIGQTVLMPSLVGPESNWVITAFTVRSHGYPTNASTASPTLNLKVFAWSSADPNAQGTLWTNGTVATIPAQWAPILYDHTYEIGAPIASGHYVTMPIIGSLSLQEDAAYAFLLDYDDAVDSGTGFFVRIETGNPNPEGMQINAVESGFGSSKNFVQADWDIVYYLQAIPEPSTVFGTAICGILLLAGGIGRGRCRNRRP